MLSLVRHERQTRVFFRIRKLDCSLEKSQRLSMTIHFSEASANQFQEPDLTACIAAGHRRKKCATEEARGSSGTSLKEGDQP